MNEVNQIILLTMCPAMFMVGGTGYLWVRRLALPILIGDIFWASELQLAKCVLMAVLFYGVFTLPYGDRSTWLERFIVGCCYSIPIYFIGGTYWQVVIPIVFILTFWLSRTDGLKWKVVEGFTGFLIAVALIGAK